jgi:hypothetical protein
VHHCRNNGKYRVKVDTEFKRESMRCQTRTFESEGEEDEKRMFERLPLSFL